MFYTHDRGKYGACLDQRNWSQESDLYGFVLEFLSDRDTWQDLVRIAGRTWGIYHCCFQAWLLCIGLHRDTGTHDRSPGRNNTGYYVGCLPWGLVDCAADFPPSPSETGTSPSGKATHLNKTTVGLAGIRFAKPAPYCRTDLAVPGPKLAHIVCSAVLRFPHPLPRGHPSLGDDLPFPPA